MSSGPSSTSSNEAVADRPSELISLLDSDNTETVEQTKSLIQENLYTSKDPSLLNALVDCYLETRSTTALQILTNVHEARINTLFDKLNDCLKHHGLRRKVDTFSLLGHIVRKQPSWLYKIVKTSLFENVIKCLKTESDVLLLINGILTLTTLLPLIATYVESWLLEFFEIYIRLAAFLNNRPGNIPDVYLLHLHVAVYYYFHRIYAMYPNNFVSFLRSFHHNSRSKQILFQTTIKPMLEHVRLHPCLVTETTQSEVGKHRWRKKEPQDIVIECQSISLDPIDRVQTDSGLTTSWTSWHEALTLDKSVNSVLITTSEDHFIEGHEIPCRKERRMSDSATQTGKSLQTGDHCNNKSLNLPFYSSATCWSPTEVCGLTTPPSEHMSPATSQQDLTVPQGNLSVSQHCCTPVIRTPGESPTSSLAGDLAHNSPGSFHHKSKRGSFGKLPFTKSFDSALVLKPGPFESHVSKVDSRENSSPRLNDNQTSTPKSLKGEHSIQCVNEKIGDKSKPEAPINSEPFTPIGKNYNFEYEERSPSVASKDEEEQLTCGDHTMTTSENVAKEIKRILSGTKFSLDGEETVPDNPPSSLEVSLIAGDNFKPENFEATVESGGNSLKDNPMCNRIEKSNSSSTVSKQCINFFAKTHDHDQSEKTSKFTQSQEGRQVSNVFTCDNDRQEHSEQKDSLNMFLSQNGHRQNQLQDPGHNGFGKTYISSQPTPVEILDNYIQIGSNVHMCELSSLSLISSPETDWSHFGGDAPLDEVEILRGQIQLLHHQLLYERHKCEQHATRNRRLIGKTFKAVQYQEELLAIKDHLKLQEEKMRELTEALVKQTEDNLKFKEITSTWDNQQQTQLRNLLNENAQLQYDKKNLKDALEEQKRQYITLKMNLDEAQSLIFSLEKEKESTKAKLLEKECLKLEVNRLTKELLVMGELNQHHKILFEKAARQNGRNPEASLHLQSCQKELSVSKQISRKQKAEIDALHSKIADLEVTLSKRENEIKELKKLSESSNGIFESKLKAVEEKYDAQKKINQSIESHILNLQVALADSKHQNLQKRRTATRSTSPLMQAASLKTEISALSASSPSSASQ